MKKYTIKEFAEGKKAVKIENEEQWNKLNKVHELCDISSRNFGEYFNNVREWCNGEWYKDHDYKLLEFSQLDFEDKFIVGKWYKRVEKFDISNDMLWFVKCRETSNKTTLHYSERFNGNGKYLKFNEWCEGKNMIEADLSEIQQYLPSNHPDLIKKDTFVLPEKWCVFSDQNKIITDWFNENQTGSYNMKQLVKDNLLFCYPAVEKWIYLANPHSCARPVKPQDYTEITFEQFQQYVLKTTKTMEKEIIGYKFKEQYLKYQVYAAQIGNYNTHYDVQQYYLKEKDNILGNAINLLKEAGVLDLWFEPVYKEEFKVGEWISFSNAARTKTITSKLKEWTAHNYCILENGEKPFKDIIRKSTLEEIKAAQIQLPTIDGYQGSYENGIIKYGCAEFSKMFFQHLNSTNSHLGNRTIKSIKLSSDVEITIEEIKQIVEYINKK